MESLFLSNLTSPPLLFFILGAVSVLVRTDLEIPDQIAKFLSLYLLMAIGFKGGVALSKSELGYDVLTGLGIALALSIIVPFYVFGVLKRFMSAADAAATAATFGSISAVTFVTSTSYLDSNGVEWNGYLVAAMALMETPAIMIGLAMYQLFRSLSTKVELNGEELIRESLLNGSVFLIVGSLVVGWVSGADGMNSVSPFLDELFIGILCLFLLDMGIVAMRRLRNIARSKVEMGLGHLLIWGLLFPVVNAMLALGLVALFNVPEGDAMLLIVLSASASYIAVPAAMRLALPEANPGIYLSISLGITFPFNLLIGIPFYHQLAVWIQP